MENKINIAAILKDCPRGMELDCTMYDGVTLDSVVFESEYHYENTNNYPIKIVTKSGFFTRLTKYGQNVDVSEAKCVIFPKGKKTWAGFVPPCQFKDGDVIIKKNFIAIISFIEPNGRIWYHCWYHTKYKECKIKTDFGIGCINDGDEIRFATEEEKQKLFHAIKENGYKWNEKTKTLETLLEPTFKNGDILTTVKGSIFIYKGLMYYGKNLADFYCGYNIDKTFFSKISKEAHFGNVTECRFATEEEKQKLFQAIKDNGYKWDDKNKILEKVIKPKFKVGDKIVNDDYVVEIIDMDIEGEVYGYKSKMGGTGGILFIEQDEWELVPDKFDVTTLKPYDKVLARCSSLEKWRIQFFEKFDKTCKFPFICMGYNKYTQCIPYEGNEHLLDTADSCSDYYQI